MKATKNKLKQFEKLKSIVITYLEKSEALRDDDETLICCIWRDQAGGKDTLTSMSAYDFMKNYLITGKIYSSDSITRARRKAQEQREDLRGRLYKPRKQKASEFKVGLLNA